MRVLIVYDHVGDSASPDQADALVQARAIAGALEKLGHEWMTLGVTLDLEAAREAVTRLNPDLVFNLVESLGGAGRLIHAIPALLDVMGVPYTGASAEAQFITSHKPLAKSLMSAQGLPTPDSITLERLRSVVANSPDHPLLGHRWVLKSLWEHASIGLDENSVVQSNVPSVILAALEARLEALGGLGFAEEYIDGREFNIALLARGDGERPSVVKAEALPAAEIAFIDPAAWASRPRMVNYACKWDEHSFEYQHTERRFDFVEEDQPLIERLERIAHACWIMFDLRGYARVDFRVDAAGEPWVLEVNTNPCLSPDAGYAAALERAGIDYPVAIDRIVRDALRGAMRQGQRATLGGRD